MRRRCGPLKVFATAVCLAMFLSGQDVHAGGIRSPDFGAPARSRAGFNGFAGSAMLRLRGGDEDGLEDQTIFDKIDGVMKATLGRTAWSLIKAMIGWHDKPRRSPSQDLRELQDDTAARKKRGQIVDRRMLYFFSRGPIYALNPLTYISRFLAGTERAVLSGVLFVNAERGKMSVADMRAKLMAPKSKGGIGLKQSRVGEVFYRADIDFRIEDMEGPSKELTFADEEDAELEAFKKKALEAAAKKGGGGNGTQKLHAAATKKWAGSSGNVVKRLQKELIGIQSTGSFDVELVDDSIFHWWVTIEGAKGSFYEDEKFKLSFKFDAKYPTEPPEVTFVAKVPGWPLPDAPTTNASGKCPSQRAGQEWPARWGKRPHHCPIHPHIYTNGNICLSIIYDDWSPALGVEAVCHRSLPSLHALSAPRPSLMILSPLPSFMMPLACDSIQV